MKDIIGQTSAKLKLGIYRDAYSKTGRLPFLLVTGERGGGKTNLSRKFRKSLRRPDGSTPPIMEVNAASIKNMQIFATSLFPIWRDNKAILFIDECHEIPKQVMTYLLTILEKDKNPVRRVTYNDREMGEIELMFDFTQMGIIMGTTDQQKLPEPLLDRMTEVSLVPYSDDELYEIFNLNLPKGVVIHDSMKQGICRTFRGHPRDAVARAEQIGDFLASKGAIAFSPALLSEFKHAMGVYDYGLNAAEIRILRALEANRSPMSLQALSASTGYSRGVIQQRYEKTLMAKGLMDIDGQRVIKQKGRDFIKTVN